MRTPAICFYCRQPMDRSGGGAKYCFQCHRIRGHGRAHNAVLAAVLDGKLPNPLGKLCVDCGAPAWEYDHRDYGKPLQVEPVCHPCNKLRGPGVKPAEAA